MKINYAIVFVSDMARSVSFYRDALGLVLRFESPTWTEFETEGTTLALHLMEDHAPERRENGGEHAGSCRTGFQVPDLDAFHLRMVQLNVPCNEAPRRVFGSKIAQYKDPDGMVFSVGEAR
jgi:lactoylglutathione lyase